MPRISESEVQKNFGMRCFIILKKNQSGRSIQSEEAGFTAFFRLAVFMCFLGLYVRNGMRLREGRICGIYSKLKH